MPTLNEGTLFYLPIKARIDMLSTGLRAPVVVKVFGPDLKVTKGLGREIERVLRAIPAIYALVESGRMQLGRTGKSGSPRTHAISQ